MNGFDENLSAGGEFGESTMAELAELRKALDIGYSQPTTGVGFDALRVESLEQTLKLLTFQAQHLKLWNSIPKDDAFSTVEEYNKLLAYGAADAGAFVASGQLPETQDSSYERADQKVKYTGITREVNHPATLVRTIPADLIAQETENGALDLLGKINSALYNADASVVPLEWNGLIQQIEGGGGLVVDLRGRPLDKDDLEDATTTITNNYGFPTKMFSNSKVFSDFGKVYAGQQRWNAPNAPSGMAGTPVTGYKTQVGDITFEPDVFVREGGAPPTAATSAKAPAAPTITLAVNAPTVTGSLFGAADAGAYKYQVTAINNYGESAPCALSAGQTIAANGACTLTITDGAGTYAATGYKIYRTTVGGSTTKFVNKRVARSATNGVYDATTTWQDLNKYLPGTFCGLLLDMRQGQSLNFKQLSPMIKMPLAQIAPSIRWMQLLYGTPIVYAPKFNAVFRNIGKAS